MPGADARAGRAGSGVCFREVVFAPIVQFERVAFAELLRLVLRAAGFAVQQPPRRIEAGRAGAENRIGFFCHDDYSNPSRRIWSGKSFSGMTTSTSDGWLVGFLSSCSTAFSSLMVCTR